ncbi:MAG TPA: prepilin-type N-terminal cleavage/methylation domain-containing protein [Candidatus Hydrogenedentes bacterium]|nr:prepilin-type N-terminal cleavage/methylation domain-containing protein [Candidatus Hydrogenedentota bacterium]
MRRDGFSLIELLFAISLLVVATGSLFGLAIGVQRVAESQEASIRAQEEAGKALLRTVRELAGAAAATLTPLPGPSLSFQIATDTDGNGVALARNGTVELSDVRNIRRENDDENGDGVVNSQLLLFKGDAMRVLCNGLTPNEDANGNGVLDDGEDLNGNKRLDRGIWFESAGKAVRVTIDTQFPDTRGHWYTATLTQDVIPRN